MQSITKLCADHLRNFSNDQGIKLKASHAHELVAAYFGYKSNAALLADNVYPIEKLSQSDLLVFTHTDFINERRQSLQELPADLSDSYELGTQLYFCLEQEKLIPGVPWPTYEYLAKKFIEIYLREQGHQIAYQIFGVMIRQSDNDIAKNKPLYEGIKTEVLDNSVNIIVGQKYFNRLTGVNRPFGDLIDVTINIKLARIAGRVGYAKPAISHVLQAPHGWIDSVNYGTN